MQVAGWLDERPYRIDELAPIETQHILPAGGTLSIPVAVQEEAMSWQLSLAWGTNTGSDDLDVKVRNGSGEVVADSETINGTALYGRT